VKYRLLIAVEVLDFTAALTRREQEVVWKRFREIREYPHHYSDYRKPDSEGRLLDVHVHSGFANQFLGRRGRPSRQAPPSLPRGSLKRAVISILVVARGR
jgi:hypothetical protein